MLFTLSRRQNWVQERMKKFSNCEPDNLDKYIDGVAGTEPPRYRLSMLHIDKGVLHVIPSAPLKEPTGSWTSTIPDHVAQDFVDTIKKRYQALSTRADNINLVRKYNHTLLGQKSRIILAGGPTNEIALSEATLKQQGLPRNQNASESGDGRTTDQQNG
ncbi:hypothetical protein AOQ84DRAFT_361739 [Glonium stellatum]|uniref:Uncharacterized protein n=1 Tax=Glonium stellatum TaxID=574774 RepID=A0A8E2JVY5_9PEZI|nr:hypothetical protein AOQ84DRAFT_361739 [Glonium stellatum]